VSFGSLRVSIPSADSRSELCGTDTHCLRCVGCNRDFFSPVFRIGFEAPIHPPSGRLSGPSQCLQDTVQSSPGYSACNRSLITQVKKKMLGYRGASCSNV